MRILLTGADGYIGAKMGPYLLSNGYDVRGVDIGYYRAGWLYNDAERRPETVTRDIRDLDLDDLRGFDAVVHLAELSNDPLGAHDRENTYDINFRGTVRLALLAKKARVRRFVYASSCSVYGKGNGSGAALDETAAVDPLTAYAECKVLSEQSLLDIADTDFTVTFLRNATAFGASPRMRFDIVLNNLAGLAWTRREIAMTSDGSPWRPLVHVLDICKAFAMTLKADPDCVQGQIYNVGANDQNYRVRDIAGIVAAEFRGCGLTFGAPGSDNRSYRVRFDKIHAALAGFACDYSAEYGAAELRTMFEYIGLTAEQFNAPSFTRLSALKQLLQSGQIDGKFHFKEFVPPVHRRRTAVA